jgi:hypothetical protein
MSAPEVHQCECSTCQQHTPHPDQVLHRQMNLLLSRLDEQQRRWYVAVEAGRVGPQGDQLLSQITDMDPKTIERWTPGTRTRTGRAPSRSGATAWRRASAC